MAHWQEFLRQSRRFWEVAEAVHDPEHTSQAAGNAIHAVIAANDALCLHQLGERPGGESHSEAAQFLQRACSGTRWEQEAAQKAGQYTRIIREKNAVEYEGRSIGAEAADLIVKRAKRFLDWVEEVLPPLPLSADEE